MQPKPGSVWGLGGGWRLRWHLLLRDELCWVQLCLLRGACFSKRTGSHATHLLSPKWSSCCQKPERLNAWWGLCCQPGPSGEQPVPALALDLARSRGCCQLLAACPVKSSRIDHAIFNENHKQEAAKPCNCTNCSHRHDHAKSHSPGLSLVILLTPCFSTSSAPPHEADSPGTWT